jgi:hypothetical protein
MVNSNATVTRSVSPPVIDCCFRKGDENNPGDTDARYIKGRRAVCMHEPYIHHVSGRRVDRRHRRMSCVRSTRKAIVNQAILLTNKTESLHSC